MLCERCRRLCDVRWPKKVQARHCGKPTKRAGAGGGLRESAERGAGVRTATHVGQSRTLDRITACFRGRQGEQGSSGNRSRVLTNESRRARVRQNCLHWAREVVFRTGPRAIPDTRHTRSAMRMRSHVGQQSMWRFGAPVARWTLRNKRRWHKTRAVGRPWLRDIGAEQELTQELPRLRRQLQARASEPGIPCDAAVVLPYLLQQRETLGPSLVKAR